MTDPQHNQNDADDKLQKLKATIDDDSRVDDHPRGGLNDGVFSSAQTFVETAGPELSSTHVPDSKPGTTDQVFPRLPGFEITGRLGEGGMGTVWRAVQVSTHRVVALKIMGNQVFRSERALRRFEREVELAAMLEHPNVARVYDSGNHAGHHYYALELIDGVSLDQYIADHTINRQAILEVFCKVCAGVQAAHQRGVIHRDLKPSNILVSSDGEPHVLDFGLAKQMDDQSDVRSLITLEGEIAGTPAFMAPEQAGGHVSEIDTRTDVYALGVVLYRLLTGKSPHDLTGSNMTVLRRISDEDVLRPRSAALDLDADLEAILLKALARQKDDRYSTAGDLAQDISRYLSGDPITARHATLIYFLGKRFRKHKWGVALVAAALVAIATGIALYVVSLRAEQKRTFEAQQQAMANAQAAEERAEEARLSEIKATQQATRAVEAEGIAISETAAARKALYQGLVGLAQARLSAGDLGEARDLLDRCPPEYRGWEYHHLRNRMIDQNRLIMGHGSHVAYATFSADGSTLATSDIKGGVCIHDGHTGQLLRSREVENGLRGLAMSPNGKRLALCSSNGDIHIWNHATNALFDSYPSPTPQPRGLQWSSDGQWLAASTSEGIVLVFDVKLGQLALKLEGGADVVKTLSFRPDSGTVLAGFGDKDRRLAEWSLPDGKLLRRFGYCAGGNGYSNASYSADGSTIVAMDNGTIHVFDAVTGQLRDRFEAPGESGFSLSVNQSGTKVFTAGWDRNARVIDVASGQPAIINRQVGYNVVTSSNERLMVSWGGISNPFLLPTRLPTGHQQLSSIDDAAVSPDGSQYAVSVFDPLNQPLAIRIFDSATGWMVRQFMPPWRAYHLSYSGDGQILYALGGDGRVAAWNAEDGAERFSRQIFPRKGIAMHPTRPQLILWDHDDRPLLHDLETQQSLPFEGTPDNEVTGALNLSHDGRWMASADKSGNLLLWDVERRTLVKTFSTDIKQIQVAVPSPDGRRIATSEYRGDIRLWNVATGKSIASATDIGTVTSLVFSPQGDRIFTVGWSQMVRIWDGLTLAPIVDLGGPRTRMDAVRISGNGTRLLTMQARNHVRIWDGKPALQPSAEPLDLLARIDLALDTVRGSWQRKGSALESTVAKERSQITVPLTIEGNYRLRSRFTYLEKFDSVEFMLPVADRQVLLTLGGWPTTAKCSGLSMIHGQYAAVNETKVSPHQLTPGQQYEVEVEVRLKGDDASIKVKLDNQPFINWHGPTNALSPVESLQSARPKALSILTLARARFDELQLTMLDGVATPLRPLPPSLPAPASAIDARTKVDLLTHVEPAQPNSGNKWKLSDDGLRTHHHSDRTLLPLNVTPYGSYRLRAELTPHGATGPRTVGIILPVGAGRTALVLDHATTATHGLDLVKGMGFGPGSSNPTIYPGQWIAGQRYVIDIEVRLDGHDAQITVHLDGKRIIQWQGPQSDLSAHSDWDASAHRQNFAIATNIDVTYHKLELEMLDGQAWILSPPDKSE